VQVRIRQGSTQSRTASARRFTCLFFIKTVTIIYCNANNNRNKLLLPAHVYTQWYYNVRIFRSRCRTVYHKVWGLSETRYTCGFTAEDDTVERGWERGEKDDEEKGSHTAKGFVLPPSIVNIHTHTHTHTYTHLRVKW